MSIYPIANLQGMMRRRHQPGPADNGQGVDTSNSRLVPNRIANEFVTHSPKSDVPKHASQGNDQKSHVEKNSIKRPDASGQSTDFIVVYVHRVAANSIVSKKPRDPRLSGATFCYAPIWCANLTEDTPPEQSDSTMEQTTISAFDYASIALSGVLASTCLQQTARQAKLQLPKLLGQQIAVDDFRVIALHLLQQQWRTQCSRWPRE